MKKADWDKARQYTPEMLATAREVLFEVMEGIEVMKSIRSKPLKAGGYIAKHTLVTVYRQMVEDGELEEDPALLASIRMKPTRTLSGVTTVTVLTRPHPCPGHCVFCPDENDMPKSYLPDEPGAARAVQNEFDPFRQVSSRLQAYEAVGHPTDKIELLILGGSWTAYDREYQEWFVRRCFDAMNGRESESLEEAHRVNETVDHRNVGLVVETRPDEITPEVIAWMRWLGVTKVQMGAQSLDNYILEMNLRGHTKEDTLQACALLRAAGFKIVLHWMPNLLGSDLQSDREDFTRLWAPEEGGLGYSPDEIKIYPTQLLENAELYKFWQRGEYQPYTSEELIEMIADLKPTIPEYCRVNRVIRDIPSTHVVAGNKRTSLRQDVFKELEQRGEICRCVRCREVRGEKIDPETLQLRDKVYHPAYAEEHFLSYVTPDDKLAGYLRLSLPVDFPKENENKSDPLSNLSDLNGAALIREVHVYGQSLEVGAEQAGAAQHIGLGTSLLQEAERIAAKAGFKRLAVIAAIGTRRYYAGRGFEMGELYMVKDVRA